MSDIINVHDECKLNNEYVLFDTNVWIAIYGNDPRPEKQVYSDFYASLLNAGNRVVVNEQVISEFFNRVCKIEFESLYGNENWRKFKKIRKSDEKFKSRVAVVKEICLDILQDCEYLQSDLGIDRLKSNLSLVVDGELDLTDAALVGECESGGFILVSHDSDFADTGVKFATGNLKVLNR